ncbi:MAG: hypothetical protein PHI42_06300 [Paludibacteraceae bacterium]|nr:hypothetical protein [Paludibacteraceae bacterium]
MKESEEITMLRQQLADADAERTVLINSIKKILDLVGLFPLPPEKEIKKRAIKALSSLSTDLVFNPKEIETKFGFLKELLPLAEKYGKTT